jgi:hypothetical protein
MLIVTVKRFQVSGVSKKRGQKTEGGRRKKGGWVTDRLGGSEAGKLRSWEAGRLGG